MPPDHLQLGSAGLHCKPLPNLFLAGQVSINLETPVVGHERPEVVIANARRKLFSITMCTDLVCDDSEEGEEGVGRLLSVVSVASSKNSDDSKEKTKQRSLFPSVPKKSVTFGDTATVQRVGLASAKPQVPLASLSFSKEHPTLLMRARLVRRSTHESIFILSFSRVICDYWSSCLFIQQLADAYATLERNSTQRMSLAAKRIEAKKKELIGKYGRTGSTVQPRSMRDSPASRLHFQQATGVTGAALGHKPAVPARLSFQQVALREKQLLKFVSKEKLWEFWDSMITATIQRQRGPNRVKVVPPVRIPSGLGEKVTSSVRPQTSRLRPFTARSRPQTGKKLAGDMAAGWSTLAGPKTDFHFIKVGTHAYTLQ